MPTPDPTTVEVVTIGEAMLRLGVRPGRRLQTAETFDVHVAGAEANVAFALAQLGRSVAWVSRLPDSVLGHRVARRLAGQGVNTRHVRWDDRHRLGLYFVELADSPRRVSVIYDRSDSAAAAMSTEDVPWDLIARARLVHVSGITPALSPTCRALFEELVGRVRDLGALLSLDVNYRSKLWSPGEARACLEPAAAEAHLLVVGSEDATDVFGLEGSPLDVVRALATRTGAERVVLTLGGEGAAWWAAGATGLVPAVKATVIDRLGAGDAFTAGVIHGMLDDDLEKGIRYGTAMGALALGVEGDELVTSIPEVETVLEHRGRSVDR